MQGGEGGDPTGAEEGRQGCSVLEGRPASPPETPPDVDDIESFMMNKIFGRTQKRQELAAWCDWVLCPPTPGNNHATPTEQLDRLVNAREKQVCGHVFKAGEVAYNCLTCQVDDM